MQKLWNPKTRAIVSLIIILVVLGGIVYLLLKIKTPAEEIPNTDTSYTDPEENDSFQDYGDLHITPIASNVGYKTGLSEYPKLTWKTEKITEKSERITIDVRYPQFIGGAPVANLNAYVSKIFNDIIAEDRKDLEEMVQYDPQSFSAMLDVASRYRIIGVTNGVVSLELVIVDFTGGGAGNHSVPYTINWDLKSDRLLVPQDIFCNSKYISVLMPLVRKQMISDLEKSSYVGSNPMTQASKDWINDGTNTDPQNWQHFLFHDKGLIVVFSPYQVAAGVAGIVRTYVPYTSIPNLVCLP